jgi:uncharacterized protein
MTMYGGDEAEPYSSLAETASAVVVCLGERVYKVKKPVNLGFLDFTTLASRAVACRRETELNRRYAPDVYIGVAELRDPSGQVCEYLVVMRRMPASRRLSVLVKAGVVTDRDLEQIARLVAAQHAAAERSPRIAEQGTGRALLSRWNDNLREVEVMAGQPLDRDTIEETGALARQFITGREALFDSRIGGGHVLDGHGDLLADDIYCLDDGPRVLDCLDFDDRLRWVDGLDDTAFLAMDLERLGSVGAARAFLDWYADFSGDHAPASLRHHYVAYRAFVRAKVAGVRCSQGDLAAGPQAHQLAQMTLRHLRAGQVTLAVVGGLPGTGKSSLAGAIGDRLGWVVLSSDRIRKELAGIPPEQSAAAAFGTGLYSAEWTDRCYAELLRRAAALLAQGESVIADASWVSAARRAVAANVARAAQAELAELCCTAEPDVLAGRLQDRGAGPSDAKLEIARQMAQTMEPWPSATLIDTTAGGTPQAPGDLAAAVDRGLAVVRPQGAEHVWRPSRPVMLPD